MKNESFIEQYAKFRDEVWEKDPHYRGFLAALEELNQETDRGVALVATSFLDKQLKDALAAFLIENAGARDLLSGFNAPFGTFGTRIAGCHALGLITDNEARQSDILRKVRNQFAHQVEVSFNAGSVKDLCNKLSVPERDKEAEPRSKFMSASMLLLVALLNRPHEVSQKRLSCGDWKSAK